MPEAGALEILLFKPNKSDVEGTKKAVKHSADAVSKAEGSSGVVFEGVTREEPELSIRATQWASHDGHAQDFYSSSEYSKHIDVVSRAHYKLEKPVDLVKHPKVIEFVVYHLKKGADTAAFFEEWSEGLKGVESTPGCCAVALGQQIEDPTGIVQIQPWMTLDDHLIGFKTRPDVDQVMKPLGVTVDKYIEGGWKGMKAWHLILTGAGEAA